MSVIARAVSAVKDLVGKVSGADAQDRAAQLAVNQQTLVGMEQLTQRINATQGGLSVEEYNERLRKEGGGL